MNLGVGLAQDSVYSASAALRIWIGYHLAEITPPLAGGEILPQFLVGAPVTQDEQIVRRAPLFTALDDAAAASLRGSMENVRLGKGAILFSEGDEGDHLYVIVEGKLKLGTSSGDGRENLLSVLGPGEMFGELSLFDPGPRTSTATAVTDVRMLSLGHDQVVPWIT